MGCTSFSYHYNISHCMFLASQHCYFTMFFFFFPHVTLPHYLLSFYYSLPTSLCPHSLFSHPVHPFILYFCIPCFIIKGIFTIRWRPLSALSLVLIWTLRVSPLSLLFLLAIYSKLRAKGKGATHLGWVCIPIPYSFFNADVSILLLLLPALSFFSCYT